MIISFEGIIGISKSSQSQMFAERHGFKLFPEPADTDPRFKEYLNLFYADSKRYALEFQYFTLGLREELEEAAIDHSARTAQASVLDRTRRGDDVFAWLHYQKGNISEIGYRAYSALNRRKRLSVERWMTFIYLTAPVEVCYERIKERARAAEKQCDPNFWIPYLTELDARYFYEMDKASREEGRLVLKVDASGSREEVAKNIDDVLFNFDPRWNTFWNGWSAEVSKERIL